MQDMLSRIYRSVGLKARRLMDIIPMTQGHASFVGKPAHRQRRAASDGVGVLYNVNAVQINDME